MFFAILLFIVWALFAAGITPDQFGWLFLRGGGWFAGFMDSQFVHRKKSNADKTFPPDHDGPPQTSDEQMFN